MKNYLTKQWEVARDEKNNLKMIEKRNSLLDAI